MAGSSWKIRGGVFGYNTYVMSELHFHWGEDNTRGSEHTLDGKQFPLEVGN